MLRGILYFCAFLRILTHPLDLQVLSLYNPRGSYILFLYLLRIHSVVFIRVRFSSLSFPQVGFDSVRAWYPNRRGHPHAIKKQHVIEKQEEKHGRCPQNEKAKKVRQRSSHKENGG